MFWYYSWAIAEKVLSLTPGGGRVYALTSSVVTRKRKGFGPQFVTSFPLTRKAVQLVPPGGTVLDFGTGWFHHDAFLLYLSGDYRVILFDIKDKAKLTYIKNYLANLLSRVDVLADELSLDRNETSEKLRKLIALDKRSEIYRQCKFVPCITPDVTRRFLPAKSVDFVISNCVLVHIRPDVLIPELKILREILTDNGYMYHLLGHDDHWAFHVRSMDWPSFNYYRYSDRTYRLIFDTKFEYHNRLVKPEWLEIFEQCDLQVEEYEGIVTDDSRDAILRLPRINPSLEKFSLDDLAVIHSYILLRKKTTQTPD